MATHAYIGYKQLNGEVYAIYCHFDGYLDVVGKALLEECNTEQQVIDLINEGDLSYLRVDGKEFCFDRGECWNNVAPRIYKDVDEYVYDVQERYVYLWDDGWQINEKRQGFVPLSAKLTEKERF